MCKRFLVHKPLCVRISARKNCSVQGLLCVTSSVCRNVSVQNASPQPKRKKNETKESKIKCLVSLPFDGNDACRAPQGVILAVLSQFLKASGTNYFLRVIPTKVHFFLTYFLTCYLAFAFYLKNVLQFFLAFYLIYLRRFFAVEIWRSTL